MSKKRSILVTGGTGSFGHKVADRFLKRDDIERVVVFSRDEKKQHDMRQEYAQFTGKKLRFVIGDVRDKDSLWHVLRGVDIVFHAAALKQVPTGEFFPWEHVKTNVMGAHNVADIAEQAGVQKVVFLSTDKAVHPVNAMGMTKALAEKVMTAFSRVARTTTFCAVRYGNVAASRGSVIPLFIDRIKEGKPLPVTVPHMTRFLLSLDDAVDLVELAVEKGNQGDIFVKKSPASTVRNLAQAILELFGSDLPIDVVGIREGEKIHEILANDTELMHSEDLGTHFRLRTNHELDYKSYFERSQGKEPETHGHYSSEVTEQMSVPEIKKFLLTLSYVQDELKAFKRRP